MSKPTEIQLAQLKEAKSVLFGCLLRLPGEYIEDDANASDLDLMYALSKDRQIQERLASRTMGGG